MLQTTKQGDALTVYLTGEIDHCVAEGLRNEIEMLIVAHDPHRLILDFSQVSFMDSSGIGMIIGRYKTMVGASLPADFVRRWIDCFIWPDYIESLPLTKQKGGKYMNNQMELKFSAIPENEAFARMVVSAFLVQANPTLSIVSEVRTAVSEAVTNAIVHAYEETSGYVMLRAWIDENDIRLEIEDQGKGIENIKQAMQPFYTSHPEQERTGMGFALMQSFMDHVRVQSSLGNGTIVFMRKRLHENDE